MLDNGKYGEFLVDTGLTNKGNAQLDMRRRASMAYILATNPETFAVFAQNNVNLFHGTNIAALPDILNHGMNSFDELTKKGVNVSTGEKITREYRGRNFISFTDDIDTAVDYAGIKPFFENQPKDKSFEMVIGISSDDAKTMKQSTVNSDVIEMGIEDKVPVEKIKVIGVPENKVEFVKKLVGDKLINVVPVNMDDRFYYIDSLEFYINNEKAQKFVKGQEQKQKETFNKNDIKEIATTRKISQIRKAYRKIKEKIKSKGKNIENDSRE